MNGDSWAPINAIISGLAALGGLAAAWIGVLVYRKQREGEFPVVSVRVISQTSVEILVDNYSSTEWVIESLELLKPSGMRGNLTSEVETYDPSGRIVRMAEDDLESRLLTGSIPINYVVRPAGTNAGIMGIGSSDKSRVSIYLRGAPHGPQKLRLHLASQDVVQRRKSLVIKRSKGIQPLRGI